MSWLSRASNSTPAIQLTQAGESMQRVMEVKEGAEDFGGWPCDAYKLAAGVHGQPRRALQSRPLLPAGTRLLRREPAVTFSLSMRPLERRLRCLEASDMIDLTIETRLVPGRMLGRLMPALLLLSACSTWMGTGKAPTPAVSLTSEEAVAMAVEVASHPQPELRPGATSPVVLTAELIGLDDALRRVGGDGGVSADWSPGDPVWLVALQGEWRSTFPRPANEEEESYNTCGSSSTRTRGSLYSPQRGGETSLVAEPARASFPRLPAPDSLLRPSLGRLKRQAIETRGGTC